MIIDEVVLAGPKAYLRKNDGGLQLRAGEEGVSLNVGKGELIDVSGIDVFLVVDDLLGHFQRKDKPMLEVHLQKEMFPDLFLDPYEHRVHEISGFEDIRNGELEGGRALEVEGVPTIVSSGSQGTCYWRSAKYRTPAPTVVDAFAWDLAISRLLPDSGLEYSIHFSYWAVGNESLSESQKQSLLLTGNQHHAKHERNRTLDNTITIVGYQIEFKAEVGFESELVEFHGRIEEDSLGTALLQAFYVVEQTSPTYHFHSIQELVASSVNYQMLDVKPPLKLFTGRLHLHSTLVEGESLKLVVNASEIELVEARLDATIRRKPPEPEKQN